MYANYRVNPFLYLQLTITKIYINVFNLTHQKILQDSLNTLNKLNSQFFFPKNSLHYSFIHLKQLNR